MTPLEAMCEAMRNAACGDDASSLLEEFGGWGEDGEFDNLARAALDALAENVSEGMVEAGRPWAGVAASSARNTFTAMLQRAKEEG